MNWRHPRAMLLCAAMALACACCSRGGDHSDGQQSVPTSPTAGSTSALPSHASVGTAADFGCASFIDHVAAPPEGYQIFADAVALNVDPTQMTLPGRRNAGDGYFVKTGLLIRPAQATLVSVAPNVADKVTIGWGTVRAEDDATALVIPVCPGPTNAGSQWLVYAGGFYVDRAVCVPLLVRSRDLAVTARIPVGAPCT